jgi:transposase
VFEETTHRRICVDLPGDAATRIRSGGYWRWRLSWTAGAGARRRGSPGVTLQIVRDWVLRFNAGGPGGLATRKAPGRASILKDEQRARLAEIMEAGPIPASHGVVRWRLASIWPSGCGMSSSCRSRASRLGRELRAMGYRKLSARPRHHVARSPDDVADFKKASPPVWRRSSGGSRKERR